MNSVQRGLKTALAAKRIDEEMYRARLKPVAEPMLLEAARSGNVAEVKVSKCAALPSIGLAVSLRLMCAIGLQRLVEEGTSADCTNKDG